MARTSSVLTQMHTCWHTDKHICITLLTSWGNDPHRLSKTGNPHGLSHHSLDERLQWIKRWNNKTVLLRGSAPAADSPREVWWTISCNYTVLFLSRDVKNTNFNQYLPVDLTSLNESNSRFRKPVMFWRWRRHGVVLWRHSRGTWHNCLLLATASNVNYWADVANHVTWLWLAGDTENFKCGITG